MGILNLLKSAASFSVPSWVSAAAILAVFGAYTGWIMYRQHTIDQVAYNKLDGIHQRFVEQVRGIGQAALATNARVAAENKARLEKMESDHATREKQLKLGAAESDRRNSDLVDSLRLQLASVGEGGNPGGGAAAGAPVASSGTSGVECYDAPDLEKRVRGSLGRFLARASGVVRRGEEAESIAHLCRDFAAGFAP